MKLAPPLVAAFCAAVAVAGCRAPPVKQTEAEQARTVTVVQVQSRAITGALTASGNLLPREEAAVSAEVAGYRVLRVRADVGDYVRAGQTLVDLDPALLEAQIAQARAQTAQAEDQAQRVAGLDDAGVVAQEQIAQRRFQAEVANANLRQLLTQRRKLAVVAPVSGLILEKTVRPGDLSGGGTTPWFRMARDGLVELSAEMGQAELARVRPGQEASVTLASGAAAQGRVRLVSPQIDPQTKLGEVRITLPVRPDIRAGGFARAVFSDAAAQMLAAPETAVRYDSDGASVMTVGSDNKVKRVVVQTGVRGGGWVELVKGPPEGARIVQNAAAFLLEGDLVRPLEPAAAPPAASSAAGPPAVPSTAAPAARRP